MSITYREGTIADVIEINTRIPEFDPGQSEDKLSTRIAGRVSLILVAEVDNVNAGYKLAYQRSQGELYSWLGAVAPDYRNLGIARRLIELQEQWASKHGFEHISVKSMNRFPAMLKLLVSCGYLVSGYEDTGDPVTSKICFSKYLDA